MKLGGFSHICTTLTFETLWFLTHQYSHIRILHSIIIWSNSPSSLTHQPESKKPKQGNQDISKTINFCSQMEVYFFIKFFGLLTPLQSKNITEMNERYFFHSFGHEYLRASSTKNDFTRVSFNVDFICTLLIDNCDSYNCNSYQELSIVSGRKFALS